ncbi:MAG: hypothetical protein CH104c_0194 [Candidatus Woesebacteria bacterium]|nr:MAG: hypothetical protein CH104c_0194 [Candidatus Woesebacteria bacterium]
MRLRGKIKRFTIGLTRYAATPKAKDAIRNVFIPSPKKRPETN